MRVRFIIFCNELLCVSKVFCFVPCVVFRPVSFPSDEIFGVDCSVASNSTTTTIDQSVDLELADAVVVVYTWGGRWTVRENGSDAGSVAGSRWATEIMGCILQDAGRSSLYARRPTLLTTLKGPTRCWDSFLPRRLVVGILYPLCRLR